MELLYHNLRIWVPHLFEKYHIGDRSWAGRKQEKREKKLATLARQVTKTWMTFFISLIQLSHSSVLLFPMVNATYQHKGL